MQSQVPKLYGKGLENVGSNTFRNPKSLKQLKNYFLDLEHRTRLKNVK